MNERIDDLCPRPERLPPQPTSPLVPAIYPAAVYECRDPQQADDLLSGQSAGYVYQRDRQPNADLLAEKCRELHRAERAAITSSGMSALAAALLSQVAPGDHLIVSNQLYGRSLHLLVAESRRLGIESTVVDTCDLGAVQAAVTPNTKLVIVETITNPLLRVSDLGALAELTQEHGARLLVDNTFAGPAICRPLEWGADLVMESITKTMNGHSDVILGLLCGAASAWSRVPNVLSTWGLSSAPFECWLAQRGLGTLALRVERACTNALAAAQHLAAHTNVADAYYPGLVEHPDHALALRQFGGRFGTIVTFTLPGGRAAAEAFMKHSQIPFCPSLGDLCTTLSHPESTSHRGLTPAERAALGITGGTIRLSVGIESREQIIEQLTRGLDNQ